jgi:hypothetical protein
MPRKPIDNPKRIRHPISVAKAQQLEVYYFRLVMFTISKEYSILSNKDKSKIDKEVSYMGIALPIIQNLFNIVAQRRSVVAWKKKFKYETDIYKFSSASVLAEALEIEDSNVYRCLQKNRLSAKGWCIRYENEFEEEQSKIKENG